MNKREIVLSLIDDNLELPYIPAAFFLHFDPAYHRGQAAVQKHLEYFQYTGMDFVKIQYENKFPNIPTIKHPKDWEQMPRYGSDFYEDQWHIARRLVQEIDGDALVMMTLYSPFMCAGHTTSGELLTQHIKEDPEAVNKGMEAITDSLMTFVKGCIEAGVDGFYHSTQGGETHRFEDPSLFATCIKPFDLVLMEEINRVCEFNILHVCDYKGGYSDLTPFLDYPGDIVNASLELGDQKLTGGEISEMFDRPFMGGMDRHGIIVSGSPSQIAEAVNTVAAKSPPEFILGADCTVPSDIPWENIKTAIKTAHKSARG